MVIFHCYVSLPEGNFDWRLDIDVWLTEWSLYHPHPTQWHSSLQIGLRYIHVQPPTNLLRKQQSFDKLGRHFLHSHSLFTVVITSGWSPWLSTPLAGIIYIYIFHMFSQYKRIQTICPNP